VGIGRDSAAPLSYAALAAEHSRLVAENAALRDQVAEIAGLSELVASQAKIIEQLQADVIELKRQLGQNSGNSGKPSSRDPVAERQRQAEERRRRAEGKGSKRRQGKQRGAPGSSLAMSEYPDEVIDYRPDHCGDCGGVFTEDADQGFAARQVFELPKVEPVVTEHRAHTYLCGCGHRTTAAFPADVRAPVSYGPRARAIVAYLLGRQHLPNRRVKESMEDLFGLPISSGAIDSVYADAGRRLKGFIAALVLLLRTLPVLHADETSDRVGTVNCWMHVVSTSLYTLVHASRTRGSEAIEEAGVLRDYKGVIVHDRLALYWKLKKAKHGLCGAHLLRDLADVAVVFDQTAWASGLAALLVEINSTCEAARLAGRKSLAPREKHEFSTRYDALVAAGIAANPSPLHRKRDYVERRSFNLVTAFATHKRSILRYMNDLDVGFTNNQAERDLRPTKLHRKISGCFRSQAGAERFAHLRSYLSTTRKNGIPAIEALTRLFNGDPWMPPALEGT
jgi:transposase